MKEAFGYANIEKRGIDWDAVGVRLDRHATRWSATGSARCC